MEDIMILANKQQLIDEQSMLMTDKMKLDKFFSLFLDKVGSKMDADNLNTPIWKLYKEKLNEYEKVTRRIKVLEYYINGK